MLSPVEAQPSQDKESFTLTLIRSLQELNHLCVMGCEGIRLSLTTSLRNLSCLDGFMTTTQSTKAGIWVVEMGVEVVQVRGTLL